MGTGSPSTCKRKGWKRHTFLNVPAQPYSIGISSIARIIQPYSGGRVWADPTKNLLLLMPDQYAKIQKTCIRCSGLAILLLEKKFDNMKVAISDSKFLHI